MKELHVAFYGPAGVVLINNVFFYSNKLVGNKEKGRISTKHSKYSEKWTFLTPDAHRFMCISEGKCSFFGKFAVFCFLVTSVLRFILLPYYRRPMQQTMRWSLLFEQLVEISHIAWKMSVFGVIQVAIFPHLDWEILFIFPYSVQMRENADQNNSEYGHLLRSVTIPELLVVIFQTASSFESAFISMP